MSAEGVVFKKHWKQWLTEKSKYGGIMPRGRKKFRAKVLDTDPFDVSTKPAPAQLSWAKWFVEITKNMPGQTYHIRRVHYQTLGKLKPNGMPYDNIDGDSARLAKAAEYARYLGMVDFDKIEDHKNEGAMIVTPYAPDELPTAFEVFPRCLTTSRISNLYDIIDDAWQSTIYYDMQSRQPYHLEIWIEKSTLNDVLMPFAKKYGATLVVAGGQFSLTNVKDCFYRIKDLKKPVRLFYLRDFDPAGETMPRAVSRKLEWFVRRNKPELDVKLLDVALTHEQCIKFKLPRTPMERGESYKGNFESKYGEGATELDALEALHPGKLAEILAEAIEQYFDEELEIKILEFSNQERERYEEYKNNIIRAVIKNRKGELLPLAEQFNGLVEEANKIGKKIENIIFEAEIEDGFKPELPERSKRVVSDTNSSRFLLDTLRDYDEQLKVYRLSKASTASTAYQRLRSHDSR